MAHACFGLRSRWAELLGPFGAGPEAADHAFDLVAARYSEPHRRYHNLEHIAEVLDVVDRLDPSGDPAVRFAAWLHDVVYEPLSQGNEAASAAFATEVLRDLGVPKEVCAEAARLIELTEGHLAGEGDERGAVIAAADLAILAAAPDRYDRYAADVRAEYGFVSDDDWRAGRSRVLSGFLARTDLGSPRARENMSRELAALAEPGGA